MHLLAYIKHQYYLRQDVLVDILLKSVRSSVNTANKNHNKYEKQQQPTHYKAIRTLSTVSKTSREVINNIDAIVQSPVFQKQEKLHKLKFY